MEAGGGLWLFTVNVHIRAHQNLSDMHILCKDTYMYMCMDTCTYVHVHVSMVQELGTVRRRQFLTH